MNVEFYFWGFQCPLNQRVYKILKEYEDKFEISYFDVSNDIDAAKNVKMYFPTMIIVDKKYRYYNPMTINLILDSLSEGHITIEKPYLPVQGNVERTENLIFLNNDNVNIACNCTGQNCEELQNKKKIFMHNTNSEILGILNVDKNNNLLGGAEFIPSVMVPYDIPRAKDTAFITCVYPTDSFYDYKSGPLKKLELYLSNHFRQVLVITDEKGTFPNGNLEFFIKNGYIDLGIIYNDDDYCQLHMLKKVLC